MRTADSPDVSSVRRRCCSSAGDDLCAAAKGKRRPNVASGLGNNLAHLEPIPNMQLRLRGFQKEI